ncbi:GerAB/ArcD/ProY family transporter [Pseudobacteroides cellulosolvens]|uniref:Spore germination protein n=1 Tax=Pseudobacteroides cellulosolvens ATCC 35603 = DSM 2933 TaxID=398512 RepID=A0A0L6JIB5_9FIRM|nr:endospore germination permease [Pseudobacteroides cellulosolvens]KNY25601.1 spore germination protein [Pseudobacteroides cellulosolvens ATCC 35603 = DSM 2933]
MYKNSKISNYQLFTLLCGFMIGSSLIVSPAAGAKQEAWLAFLIGCIIGTILIAMYASIYRLNPSCTLIEALEKNFGKILGKVFGVLYIWYFIHLTSLVLRNFGEYSVVTGYPETPILFIIVCFSLIIAFSVRAGIEVMGRISEIFLVILTAILVFVFFSLITSFDLENLKPFMTQGIKPIINTAFGIVTFPFGETIAFLMVFPHVIKQEKIMKTSIFSSLFVGLVLIEVILRNTLVLGSNMASRDIFPSHIVFRLIPNLDVDPLLDVNLTVAGIIKAGICIYAASAGIVQLLNLDDYKPFVLPFTALAVSLSIWIYGSIMEMLQWASDIWPYYSIPFQIVIPCILLILSFVRHKRSGKVKNDKSARTI